MQLMYSASFDHKDFKKMNFIIFVQFLCFIFCFVTLICDTNVKYFNIPIFAGVQKKCFYFICKVRRKDVNLYF